jgi:chromate transporter
MAAEPDTPPAGWKLLWILFWEFAKITTVVIGGGYVILTAVEAEFVRRRRWLTGEEIVDMLAIAQTVPGIIACNGAVYIGSRLAGLPGAVAALFGTVLPPVAAILLIANGMKLLPAGNPYIAGAFLGANACIVGMLIATAWRLAKQVIKGWFEIVIAAGSLIGIAVFGLNPGYLMLASIVPGIAYAAWKRRKLRKAMLP